MRTFLIHRKFQEVASLFPHKEALSFQKNLSFSSLTFREVLSYAFRINSFLKEENFKFPDKAILYMENNPFWFSTYLGIVSLGGVAIPVDSQLREEEFENILIDSEAKIIFCSESTFRRIENIKFNTYQAKIVILDRNFFKKQGLSQASFLDFSEDNLASLVYTSGTTDNPKAVMLSHKNFMYNFYSIWELGFYTHRDLFLCILPLHHTYPFMVNLLVPLLSGAGVVFPQSLKKEDILFSLKNKRISILVGVPQLFSLFEQSFQRKLKYFMPLIYFLGFIREKFNINLAKLVLFFLHRGIFPNLRYMVSGGAKLDKDVAKTLFRLGFNILEGYGLTEASPVVSFNPPSKIKIGSVGRPLPGVEVRTDSLNGKSLGEILVKGGNVSRGYFRKPHLSSQSFREGWLYTKDIGYIDNEGYIYITGRKDECIVLSSGRNIWPEELESFYEELDSIEEIGIFSRGDSLYGIVVPKKEYFLGKDREEIYSQIEKDIQSVSLKLVPYKRLSGFSLSFENLPRTRLGKLKRFLLPGIFEKTQLRKEAKTIDEFSYEIIKIVKYFASGEVKLEDDLSIIGIDSLSKIQLASFLEKSFNIKIPDEDLSRIVKVKDLVDYLRGKGFLPLEREPTPQEWSNILKGRPHPRFLKRIRLQPKLLDVFLSFLAKIIFFSVFKLFYRLRIEGLDNLPQESPFLLCPNHTSYFDGPLVFSSFPWIRIKSLYFLGLSDYFDYPLLSWLVKPGRIVPVNPEKNLREALKISALLVKNKKILCIFPEGRRSWGGSLEEFKKGVGILAKELGIKIVPVGIKGTFEAWPAFKKLPRLGSFKIIYAKALNPDDIEEKDKEVSYKKITESLREKIREILAGK